MWCLVAGVRSTNKRDCGIRTNVVLVVDMTADTSREIRHMFVLPLAVVIIIRFVLVGRQVLAVVAFTIIGRILVPKRLTRTLILPVVAFAHAAATVAATSQGIAIRAHKWVRSQRIVMLCNGLAVGTRLWIHG